MAELCELDADLLESLLSLSDSFSREDYPVRDVADADLAFDMDGFLEDGDRFLYAKLAPGIWPATADYRSSVAELCCRVGPMRMPLDGEAARPYRDPAVVCGTRPSLFLRFRTVGDAEDVAGRVFAYGATAERAEALLGRALAAVGRADRRPRSK